MSNTSVENYRKYLIEIVYRECVYSTIYGKDLVDNTDKVLVDQDGFFLLFNSIDDIIDFCKTNETFDQQNLQGWLAATNYKPAVYSRFNFEVINEDPDFDNSQSLIEVVDVVNMIQDFAIQVNEQEIFNECQDDELLRFKEEVMNKYVFFENNEGWVPANWPWLGQSMAAVYVFVASRFRIK